MFVATVPESVTSSRFGHNQIVRRHSVIRIDSRISSGCRKFKVSILIVARRSFLGINSRDRGTKSATGCPVCSHVSGISVIKINGVLKANVSDNWPLWLAASAV